jgi:hypothetical protein
VARPSKLINIQSGEVRSIVDGLNSLSDNEKAAILQLKIMLLGGGFCSLFEVPKIVRYHFEYNLGIGRADLVLFHADGGVSLVEAKADGDTRTIAGGIGQLFLYSVLLEQKLQIRPKYINRILCAPVKPEKGYQILTACRLAGVKFVHLATFECMKARVDLIRR